MFGLDDDDARTAVAAWHTLADALRLEGVRMVPPLGEGLHGALPVLPGLHPTRAAHLVTPAAVLGAVGEIDPAVAMAFGLSQPGSTGGPARRIGWLELDLDVLFDVTRVPRRVAAAGAVSRYPSSDVDLAFVVDDAHPADAVAERLRLAAGELLESVRLFDVYRGPGIEAGKRSLAYRLRFCSPDRTLTDHEVGELRTRCIEAVASAFGAVLR